VPRLGRLWRSGGRRAQVPEPRGAGAETRAAGAEAGDGGDIGQRLEEAQRRLRQTIPPPQDADPEEHRHNEARP
jgi:hypothetical protein